MTDYANNYLNSIISHFGICELTIQKLSTK